MATTGAASSSSPRDHRDLVIEDLADQVAELTARAQALREVVGASWDYAAWLQAELCRARQATTGEVLAAWWEELDRRAKLRAQVAA